MDLFKNLIHEFGKQLSADDVEADEEGYIALTFDEQTIHLQYDEQLDEVAVFTKLGTIEPDRLADICLMFLSANLFWQGTQGATFSVEPSTKRVFLADRHALSLLDVSRLNEWLERFLNITRYWNGRLEVANLGGSLLPESDNMSPFFGRNK